MTEAAVVAVMVMVVAIGATGSGGDCIDGSGEDVMRAGTAVTVALGAVVAAVAEVRIESNQGSTKSMGV